MKSGSTLVILSAIILCAATARAGAPSKEDLKKVLDKNPDLILDVLRSHKADFFKVVNEAAREEQERMREEQAAADKKEYEESFKNPKTPSIDEKTRVRGNQKAKYTLVEYSDFQCPYCARGFRTVEDLRKKYGEDLRFIFKNKPLPMHPQALPAAQYLEAAALQSAEKAWKFHDTLFANQDKLGEDFYKATAKELGLDVAKLEKDAKSQAVKDRIDADVAEAETFGFTGTPGFLLNGVPIRGAYPQEFFESIIQKLDSKPKEQKN